VLIENKFRKETMTSTCRHRWLVLVAALISFPVLTSTSQVVLGQALAVANVSRSTGAQHNRTYLTIQLGYFDGVFFNDSPLFEQFQLTPSDIGRTFTLTASDEPDFSSFVQMLTNGFNDGLGISDNLDIITAKAEPEFFTLLAPGNNGVDLQGFQIGSIAMHIDNLIVDSPGSDPNSDGLWTDAVFEGTFTVYAVPEPSTLAIALAAGMILFRRRIVRKPPMIASRF
jgi:hypothetical protein